MTYYADIFYMDKCVCKIQYAEYSFESFEYVFEPDYDAINSLEGFRGIPGIDLSLHKKRYVRKNILPTFLGERFRLPGKVLFYQAIKVDGLCPLEYLANNNYEYFGDKLTIKTCNEQRYK